ncbi:MAG: SMC-Scp complex subunit ScpB [Chloroflexota bacterium]|nr:SMC-Scp complex subunit ScpB [Chloroflexota bacterium]
MPETPADGAARDETTAEAPLSPREERKRARERIAAATPTTPTGPAPGAPTALEPGGAALEPRHLRGVIESLLFVAGRPLEMSELRRLTGADEARARAAVAELAAELERDGRGVRVQRMGASAQLVSAPEYARFVAALLGLPTQVRLTTAALETLSVIAYRQPITRGQIEAIRGVNSDRALASLLQHGLAQEVGRAATVGRPALFGVTPEFLQQFGLTSLDALPHPDLPRAEMAEALRERAAQSIRDAVNAGDAEEAREMERQRSAHSGPLRPPET